jgi:hypothetical protein
MNREVEGYELESEGTIDIHKRNQNTGTHLLYPLTQPAQNASSYSIRCPFTCSYLVIRFRRKLFS